MKKLALLVVFTGVLSLTSCDDTTSESSDQTCGIISSKSFTGGIYSFVINGKTINVYYTDYANYGVNSYYCTK